MPVGDASARTIGLFVLGLMICRRHVAPGNVVRQAEVMLSVTYVVGFESCDKITTPLDRGLPVG